MEKKYELLKNDFVEVDNKKLYRIKALKDFSNVKREIWGATFKVKQI